MRSAKSALSRAMACVSCGPVRASAGVVTEWKSPWVGYVLTLKRSAKGTQPRMPCGRQNFVENHPKIHKMGTIVPIYFVLKNSNIKNLGDNGHPLLKVTCRNQNLRAGGKCNFQRCMSMLRDDLEVEEKKKRRPVYLTDSEWEALKDAAEQQGISASKLVALWVSNRAAKPVARGVPDRILQDLENAIRQNNDIYLSFTNGETPIPTALASALWENTVALNAILERIGKC